jgi:ribonucleoside-diphosphate reductase beta chain
MSLQKKRDYYKPFDYPWAFDFYLMQQKMHWLPEEVPLHDDVRDWQVKLSAGERNLLTQIFRFFTQADVDVAGGYVERYLPMFPKPEVRMMLLAFSAMEAVHVHAYSLLLDTVGMPEAEYKAFREIEEMREKHDKLAHMPKPKTVAQLAENMAVFSAFTEGLHLFSSFVILLNFSRFNKMKGMCQIITWSIRDESLHVEGMIKLFRTLVEEHPEIVTKEFKEMLQDTCRDMVKLEDQFIDLAFEQGPVEGLTPEEVKKYVRFIADRRLIQLGVRPIYRVKTNPLEWLDWIINSVEHANFFEQRATEYSKGSLTGSWAEVWGTKKKIAV